MIPKELILPIESIHQLPKSPLYKEDGTMVGADWYHTYFCNPELTDWIIKHCPCECHVAEYIISDCAISFHKDLGRDYAFNYILDTGGENVITEFWDDSAQQLLSSVICEPNHRYVLNVSKQHRVLEPQPRPRVLVSITPKYGVTYQF